MGIGAEKTSGPIGNFYQLVVVSERISFPNPNFSRVPSSPLIVKQWIPVLHHSTWLTFVVPLHYVGQNVHALVNPTGFLQRPFSSGPYRTIRIGPSKKCYWKMIFLRKLSIFGFLSKFILFWHIFPDEVKMAGKKTSIPIRNRIYKWFTLLPQIASRELAGVQLLWNWQSSFEGTMLLLCSSKCDRKKPMSFRPIFPSTSCRFFFRTDASALPYVCAGSQGHRCGLSFRQGMMVQLVSPLRSPVFRGCLWRAGGSGLPAPLCCRGPVLALSSAWWYCVAVAVFLVDLCTVGDWQLTQAGCFSSTRTLVWCVMCERERVSIFLQEILHGPGGSFEWPPPGGAVGKAAVKGAGGGMLQVPGPGNVAVTDYLHYRGFNLIEGSFVGWFVIFTVIFRGWGINDKTCQIWQLMSGWAFFLGVTSAIRDYGLTLGTPINQLPSRHPCEKRWTLEQLPPLFGSSNNLKCLLLPPWHEIH